MYHQCPQWWEHVWLFSCFDFYNYFSIFFWFYWEIIDIHHCMSLRCRAWWFDLHIPGNDYHNRLINLLIQVQEKEKRIKWMSEEEEQEVQENKARVAVEILHLRSMSSTVMEENRNKDPRQKLGPEWWAIQTPWDTQLRRGHCPSSWASQDSPWLTSAPPRKPYAWLPDTHSQAHSYLPAVPSWSPFQIWPFSRVPHPEGQWPGSNKIPSSSHSLLSP